MNKVETQVTNFFGQKFELRSGRIYDSGESRLKQQFFDLSEARRFIRQLDVTSAFWRRVDNAVDVGHYGCSDMQIESVIAKALIAGRLQAYRVDGEIGDGVDALFGCLFRCKNQKAYRIFSTALFDGQGQTLSFSSEKEAYAFLKTLDVSFPSSGIDSALVDVDKQLQMLGKKIKESSIVLVEFDLPQRKPSGRKPLPEDPEPAGVQPGDRIVELAPPTEPWVRFVLQDEDTNEPISGMKVKLTLPDGKSVVRTSDRNGTIYVDHLTEGYCDIESIMDDGGWEFCSMGSSR